MHAKRVDPGIAWQCTVADPDGVGGSRSPAGIHRGVNSTSIHIAGWSKIDEILPPNACKAHAGTEYTAADLDGMS